MCVSIHFPHTHICSFVCVYIRHRVCVAYVCAVCVWCVRMLQLYKPLQFFRVLQIKSWIQRIGRTSATLAHELFYYETSSSSSTASNSSGKVQGSLLSVLDMACVMCINE